MLLPPPKNPLKCVQFYGSTTSTATFGEDGIAWFYKSCLNPCPLMVMVIKKSGAVPIIKGTAPFFGHFPGVSHSWRLFYLFNFPTPPIVWLTPSSPACLVKFLPIYLNSSCTAWDPVTCGSSLFCQQSNHIPARVD